MKPKTTMKVDPCNDSLDEHLTKFIDGDFDICRKEVDKS